jgi:hypothetical protein
MVSEARATACWAASLQLREETPTNSMTRTTAGAWACSALPAMMSSFQKEFLLAGMLMKDEG